MTESSPVEGEEASEKEGGSALKGVGKHAIIYGLGIIASRAISFVMLPVYTRYLTTADYGVMALIEMTLDFISILGGAQLGLAIFRFYHKTDDPVDKQQVIATSFMMVALLYLVVGTCAFLAAGPLSRLLFGSPENAFLIRVAAVNLTMGSFTIVPLAFARVRDMSTLYVTANLIRLVLAVVFNTFFLVVMDLGVLGVFLGSTIAGTATGGFLTVWLLREIDFQASMRWTKNLLRFGAPLLGMQAATFVATFSDRYFLQAAADVSTVGVYSLAYQFGFLLSFVGFTPVDMVWGPRRFSVANRPDRDAALSRGFLLVNVVLMTTAVGIGVLVTDVLRVMAAPEFHPAARIVPVILIAYVFQAWASVQDIGILIAEKTRYLTIANVLSAIVAVAGYAVLVPLYLEWGAALATVVAFAVRYVFTFAYSQRLWRVEYEWRPVLLLTALAVATVFGSWMLPDLGLVVSLPIRLGMLLAYFAAVWFLPILTPDDRRAAIEIAGRLRASLR